MAWVAIGYAQQPTAQPARQPAPAMTMRATGRSEDLSYRIGPGDILDIRVFGRPEMTKDVRVDQYGRIRLPFLEEIPAACLTEAQLAQQIAEKYKKYLRDPQVDVMVKEFRSQPVAVIGAVGSPGRFQLQRRIRLFELLTHAGGPNNHAGNTVHIYHSDDHDYCTLKDAPSRSDAAEAKPASALGAPGEETSVAASILTALKLKDVMNGLESANPYVQPGDIISIPEADTFFVTGAVVKPGAYPMVQKITLTQAVALAGGVNGEGARNRVRLVREEPGKETRTETVFNMDEIHRRKIPDIVLRANDIVEVPGSTMRVASRNILGVGINMLTALPYFIIP
jgi:polysaccharide export outer membrane protein